MLEIPREDVQLWLHLLKLLCFTATRLRTILSIIEICRVRLFFRILDVTKLRTDPQTYLIPKISSDTSLDHITNLGLLL